MVPISYSVRNLVQRRATTAATALGIGLVVFVFASSLMLSRGIERTLGRAGSPDVAVVLRDGSDAELSSSIEIAPAGLIASMPEVRRGADGSPEAVREVVSVISLDKLGADGVSNVLVRGIEPEPQRFRPRVRVVEGRAPRPGSEEAMVGAAIRGRFRGLQLGQSFELRKNRPLTVVGIFEDGGSSNESEVWADIDAVRAAFGRQGLVSSVRVRLRSAEAFDAFRRGVEGNRQLGVDAHRETKFYEDQSSGTSMFVKALGVLIAIFFAAGAMIGATITMHASVAARAREIGTLRALGFPKKSILVSFLLESVVLSLAGGAVGAAASTVMGFVRFDIVNFASWSEIVFTFAPTPGILLASMVFATAMGLFGGLFPAVRAARMPVLDALRG